MSFKVEIKGLRELQANLSKLPQELKIKASAVVENGAKNWVAFAKRDAPVNFGVLRNEISYAKLNDLSFEVISGAEYSPYLEWGTITKVQVPPQQAAYAIQFKGRGIKKTGGIYPHPFFFKQQIPVVALVERGLTNVLNEVKL